MTTKQFLMLPVLPSLLIASVLAADVPSTIANAPLPIGSAQQAGAMEKLCKQAVSEDGPVAENAIRQLRARGEPGLRALVEAHASALQKHASGQAPQDPAWQRLRTALDAVSGQRDCHAAQLFWFTDFDQARAAARAQGRPILSLRLLGRLDEEFSCANSRFFRTTLYANQEVAAYLREHFILHWKSVRPVPRVTIDFGDGRTLERTLTGNSIHYVLDADGEVVDALPGLYGAKAFLAGLQRAETLARQLVNAIAPERSTALASYHRDRLTALDNELAADLQKISAPSIQSDISVATPILINQIQPLVFPPSASTAARVAVGKGFIETPILDRTQPRLQFDSRRGADTLDGETWGKLAALRMDEVALDAGALRLVQEKSPNAMQAGRITASKVRVENPMLRQIRNLQRSISEDTVRNEYSLHRQLHAWFAGGTASRAVDALNARVYAELFLTPDSDPWLGLLPQDTFAALENGGVSVVSKK